MESFTSTGKSVSVVPEYPLNVTSIFLENALMSSWSYSIWGSASNWTVAQYAWLVWTPEACPFDFGTESGAGFVAVAETQFVVAYENWYVGHTLYSPRYLYALSSFEEAWFFKGVW